MAYSIFLHSGFTFLQKKKSYTTYSLTKRIVFSIGLLCRFLISSCQNGSTAKSDFDFFVARTRVTPMLFLSSANFLPLQKHNLFEIPRDTLFRHVLRETKQFLSYPN